MSLEVMIPGCMCGDMKESWSSFGADETVLSVLRFPEAVSSDLRRLKKIPSLCVRPGSCSKSSG
jgi:hypothetical protein